MKILFIILSLTITGLIGFYAYWGGFHPISYQIKSTGGEYLVYENVIGDYRQSGLVSDRIYYELKNQFDLETQRGFGIYYDDPRQVQVEELHSHVGCILEENQLDHLDRIGQSFLVKQLQEKEYLEIDFPYRGRLSLLLGVMRVYPRIHKIMEELGGDNSGFIMEIWDIPGKKILYRKEL